MPGDRAPGGAAPAGGRAVTPPARAPGRAPATERALPPATARSYPRHRFPGRHFDLLAAGGGDPETISELLAVERSWRLVQLRAVLDAVRSRPRLTGPLPPVATAWELLAAAQRRDPSEVATLLLHPQAGTWAGYLLRRLRGAADPEAPLWVDLGYLHSLAAAAAIRAGLEFRLAVPVRDGYATLPTLGAAHLPAAAPWGVAEVRGSGGQACVVSTATTVTLASASDGWVPLPTIRASGNGPDRGAGPSLTVQLDHLDPYRNLRTPAAPHPLPAGDLARWQTLLDQAWHLLVTACPQVAESMARGLFSIVPQPAAERFRTMSASAGDAFGSMLISELRDSTELAVTLVHEFQHIKLGALLHLTPLQAGEPPARLYAPWRDDPRPLSGLLQGVYAFAGITEFWHAVRRAGGGPAGALAEFEFARWRSQVSATLRALHSLPQLTDAGARLLAGLAATAAGWWAEPVPVELLEAADAAVADHRARWRLHHLRPELRTVAALARSWLASEAPPDLPYPEPTVAADPAVRGLDARAVLALWRIMDPGGFAALRRDPDAVGTTVAGATAADLAAAAGDLGQARERFLIDLTTAPQRQAAWAGLGTTLTAGAATPVTALRDWPELVRGVHLAAWRSSGTPADPIALAAWLGRIRVA